MQDPSKPLLSEIKVNILENKIAHFKLPEPIIEELEEWKLECDKIKKHPLASLKTHDNRGTKSNNFQVSVPSNLIYKSYWLPFTLRACAAWLGKDHRSLYLRKWEGHFDGLDIWINYAYRDNYNPPHIHAGFLSGVIYYSNENDLTLFNDGKIKFNGIKGDMIVFDSNLEHCVQPQKENYERVTFAFNLQTYEGDKNARP